jgi:flagellar basal body-associated protein FliL
MQTATTSSQDQQGIERHSPGSIKVALIVLLYSAITIAKCFTFAKNKDAEASNAANFKAITKSKRAAKKRNPGIFYAANFETITRSKKAAKKRNPGIFNASNVEAY